MIFYYEHSYFTFTSSLSEGIFFFFALFPSEERPQRVVIETLLLLPPSLPPPPGLAPLLSALVWGCRGSSVSLDQARVALLNPLSHTHTHRCIALHKSLEITSSWLRVNLVPTERRAQKTEDTKRTVISPVRPVLHSSDSAVCGSVQPLKSAALCVITPQNSHFQH